MYVVVESCIICAHELCSSAKMLLYKKQFLLTHPLMLSVQHKLVAVVKGSQHKWLGLNGNYLRQRVMLDCLTNISHHPIRFAQETQSLYHN